MNDSEIITLYFERDERAVSETAVKYGKYCHTVSYNILQNKEDVEECVNDTYLAAWNSIPPKKPERLSTFLGKLARNLSINRYRQYNAEKRKLTQTAIALSELEECIAESGGEEIADEMALTKAINDFLLAQPKLKRNIFIRRYWYVMPIKDISSAYGISEGKIASMLFRMRTELKKHLEKEGIYL